MAKLQAKISKNAVWSKKMADNGFLGLISGKMVQNFALLTFFLIFGPWAVSGQDDTIDPNLQITLQTLIEDFTEFSDGGADFDFNTLYEDLHQAYNNKMDINKATAQEFSLIFFLSDLDIQNIINYRTTYGPFVSIYELQTVPGLSFDKLASLRLFVQVDESNRVSPPEDLRISALATSSDQLYLKWKYNIETALGFQSVNGADPKYIGDKQHIYVRYNHTSSDSRYGLIIEKDPGENFTNSRSETGVDYLSVHYQLNQPTPWMDQLNLGDYTVSMGQGLIVHNAFGVGKSSFTTSVKKGRSGARAFNSVTENQAFRGFAANISPSDSKFRGMVFGSYAPRDANLRAPDSLGISTFSSLPTSGLHRTVGEREDQDATYEWTFGSNIRYQLKDDIQIGLNAIHHKFDKTFEPNIQPYQIYRWRGSQLSNFSGDYNALLGGWNLFGEIAHSSNNGWAQVHGVVKTLDPTFDLALVYRDYGPAYQSLYANSFGENASANNERGVYLGIEYRPSRRWTVKAYADQWKNEWLRFRVDAPATGREYLMRVDYKERRRRHFYLQYRYEVKDENSIADLLVDRPVPKTMQRLRLHGSHQVNDGIELRSRIEFSLFTKEEVTERGLMVYQDVISRKTGSPLTLNARLAYFNITDFDARIYTYENDLLFEYYIPSFSGEGIRYYAHCRYQFSYHVMAELRWEQTKFFGTDAVRSNNDLIAGSTISRIKAQVRWRF